MKLKIEHLSIYLAHELRMIFEGKGGRIITLRGITNQGENGVTITDGYGGMWLDTCRFKPILRPLSDMFKEIEVDGKKFIPELIFDTNCSTVDSPIYLSNDKKRAYFKEFSSLDIREHHLSFMPYGMIDQLVSWHFDVFGLIDKGLAIDINTLNNK